MEDLILLHLGCADRYIKGFINSDKSTEWKGGKYKLDCIMDITKPWNFPDNSVDGIISMHVLQQLTWRELLVTLREARRVLSTGCVMRIGVPMIENGKTLDYLLGWNNINLFSYELLENVLTQIGFRKIKRCKYQESAVEAFKQVDNRPDQTIFIEVTK